MAGCAGGSSSGTGDDRTHIWVQDDIFMSDHNKVVRYITSRFALQTCDEGHSWKYVTPAQREWYWDEFVKKYRWDAESNEIIRQLWYRNIATLYRRTIHSWRTTDRYPETVSEARWAAWTAAWHDQGWLEKAGKNKANRSSEPAGPGTGTSKHIAGSKTYSAHYQSMRAHQGTDPTSWDLYLHTHRRPDGTFVDDRSRLVHQSMEALRDESFTPLDDGSIPDQPSPEEVNSMFKTVVGGRKKGRMYGCGSMASTIYPDEMAPRPRGWGSRSSQDSQPLREVVDQQSRVIEFMRVDLQASQSREQALLSRVSTLEERVSRVDSLEDQVRLLVAALPHGPPTSHGTHVRGASSSRRSIPDRSRQDPHGATSSRGIRFTASSSRPATRGKVLRAPSSTDRSHSPPPHRFHRDWVDPSQDFGDDDDDDDDDETQEP